MGNPVDGIDGPILNGNHAPAPTTNTTMPNSNANPKSKGKGKGKSAANAGGKMKSKASVNAADEESDSSFENHNHSKFGVKSGKGKKYDDLGEEDGDVEVDGDDDYVIRTDHLKAGK